MERPLTLLRRRDRLLVGSDVRILDRAECARDLSPSARVLLAEREPVRFLAIFAVAVEKGCELFLGNPDWSDRDWEQAIAIVSPDWIFCNGTREPGTPQTARTACGLQGAIAIPTGGSSGQLRFVLHSWETLTASAGGFQAHFSGTVNCLCVLPLFHVSGLMQFARALTSGGKLAIAAYKSLEFDAATGALVNPSIASEWGQYFLSLVPTQLQRLLAAGGARWLAQFRAILLGGAPAWSELLIAARSHQLPLALTYGSTETASQVATLKPEEFASGNTSSGRSLPHARISIRDETGVALPTGTTGAIAISARSLCAGYFPRGIISEPFLTDDLGFLDRRGFLTVVGRRSRKILSGGENVYPEAIEAIVRATRLVCDVCVVGIADRDWGEAVAALYVPRAPTVSVARVQNATRDRLSPPQRPKFWHPCAAIPRNAVGKVDYAAVTARLQQARRAKFSSDEDARAPTH